MPTERRKYLHTHTRCTLRIRNSGRVCKSGKLSFNSKAIRSVTNFMQTVIFITSALNFTSAPRVCWLAIVVFVVFVMRKFAISALAMSSAAAVAIAVLADVFVVVVAAVVVLVLVLRDLELLRTKLVTAAT